MTFLPNELDSLDEIDTFLEKKKKNTNYQKWLKMENLKRPIFIMKSESVILNFTLKWNRAPAKLHAQMALPANCQAFTQVTPTYRNVQNTEPGGFPGGSMLWNPPTNAGYKGWIPDTRKMPPVEEQLSPCIKEHGSRNCWSPCTTELVLCSKKTTAVRSPHTTN